MSPAWSRRTALPRARGGWVRLWLVLLVASGTFALFCVSAPEASTAERRVPSPVPSLVAAPSSAPLTAPSPTADERPEAVTPRQADREPCEEGPGHRCDSPDHHGVLGHTPLVGADRAPSPWQSATAPGLGAFHPSREPGAARPPDLHELQLLRV
jgi:hypothetical protein